MKGKPLQLNNTIREGVTIPLMIILYGVPAVLLILFTILMTLGIRLILRKYGEMKHAKGNYVESSTAPAPKEVLEPVVGWEAESEAAEDEASAVTESRE